MTAIYMTLALYYWEHTSPVCACYATAAILPSCYIIFIMKFWVEL